LFQLSRLSVWWLRLGITIERIQPGHPQQNGRHERMHLTLKQQATRLAGANILQQQGKFDAFMEEFNAERPHEAPGDEMPCGDLHRLRKALYRHSGTRYPFHDRTVMVTSCGRLCLYRKKINLSKSLAGQAVGVKEVDNGIWLVTFMEYDLGYIDLEERTLQPLDNPFGPKVLPMS
jgi:Integrase core domain